MKKSFSSRIPRHFSVIVALTLGIGLVQPATAQAQTQNAEPLTIEASDVLEWNQSEGTYVARGSAIARQGETQIKAETLSASYDPKSETRRIDEIIATGGVAYSSKGSSATGERLVYNIAGTNYLVEGKNATVTGVGGTMSAQRDIYYDATDPTNKVIIARTSARYIASDKRSIAGERIVGNLDSDGTLQTLDAKDNVVVTTIDGQVATGDAVTYDYTTSKAVLTGNVEIIDGNNVMRGARAEVDFNSGNSRILSDGSGKRVSGVLGQ